MSPDVAASVRARLLNQAKQRGEEFKRTLARVAGERLLFRLGASRLRWGRAPACGGRLLLPAAHAVDGRGAAGSDTGLLLATRWRNYLAAGAVLIPPPSQFADIGERIIAFLGPVRESILAGEPLAARWSPAGPWTGSAPLQEQPA